MAVISNLQRIENNITVKEFLESDNPTLSQYAKAYSIRDRIYGRDINEIKSHVLDKLALSEKVLMNYLDRKFRKDMIQIIDNFLKNGEPKEIKIEKLYLEYINSSETKKLISDSVKRFEELNSINDMESFYNNLTCDDLSFLGW